MSGIFRITRREFLRDMGVGTGALVFGYYFSPSPLFATERLKTIIDLGFALHAFVYIKPVSGHITIFTHRSEMGQGIKSSLAAVLTGIGSRCARLTLTPSTSGCRFLFLPLAARRS